MYLPGTQLSAASNARMNIKETVQADGETLITVRASQAVFTRGHKVVRPLSGKRERQSRQNLV
jgi:hypothetical protein